MKTNAQQSPTASVDGTLSSLPLAEVQAEDAPSHSQPELKIVKTFVVPFETAGFVLPGVTQPTAHSSPTTHPSQEVRQKRLERNRLAARESRRRRKAMVAELQRSVNVFVRANGTLKKQNHDLERLITQAQAHIDALVDHGKNKAQASVGIAIQDPQPQESYKTRPTISTLQQAHVHSSAFAEPSSNTTLLQDVPHHNLTTLPSMTTTTAQRFSEAGVVPPMNPGATMQAMAAFQEATAAAMQVALPDVPRHQQQQQQGMRNVVDHNSLGRRAQPTIRVAAKNSQQLYKGILAAFALQQAAVAAGQNLSTGTQ